MKNKHILVSHMIKYITMRSESRWVVSWFTIMPLFQQHGYRPNRFGSILPKPSKTLVSSLHSKGCRFESRQSPSSVPTRKFQESALQRITVPSFHIFVNSSFTIIVQADPIQIVPKHQATEAYRNGDNALHADNLQNPCAFTVHATHDIGQGSQRVWKHWKSNCGRLAGSQS
jgi:hypothetical protein